MNIFSTKFSIRAAIEKAIEAKVTRLQTQLDNDLENLAARYEEEKTNLQETAVSEALAIFQ